MTPDEALKAYSRIVDAKDAEIARWTDYAATLETERSEAKAKIARLREALREVRASLSEANSAYFEEVIAHCIRTADAALSVSPAPDPAEAMRAKCEAIARKQVEMCDWEGADTAAEIADEIAALKGNGEE